MLHATPELATLRGNVLAVEQPLDRSIALDPATPPASPPWSAWRPVIIDESDGTLTSYREALTSATGASAARTARGRSRALLNAGLTWLRNDRGRGANYPHDRRGPVLGRRRPGPGRPVPGRHARPRSRRAQRPPLPSRPVLPVRKLPAAPPWMPTPTSTANTATLSAPMSGTAGSPSARSSTASASASPPCPPWPTGSRRTSGPMRRWAYDMHTLMYLFSYDEFHNTDCSSDVDRNREARP